MPDAAPGSSGSTEQPTITSQQAWEAACCMVVALITDEEAKSKGVPASLMFSLHQGLAQLLEVKGGLKTGEKLKAKMGDGSTSFLNAMMSAEVKRSKAWKINTQADGSVKCLGSTEALKSIHKALVARAWIEGAYDTWSGSIASDIFKHLLAVAPWKKQERKVVKEETEKETPSKLDGKLPAASKAVGNKPVPTKATADAEMPELEVILFDDEAAATAAAEQAMAVVRNQARGNTELLDAAAQLQGALDFLSEAASEAGSASAAADPDAGMLCSVEGNVLTYEFPAIEKTVVMVKATPKRSRFQLQITNPDPIPGDALLQTHKRNKVVGLQPGVYVTPHITVPENRVLLDVEPPAAEQEARAKERKKPLKHVPRGQQWFNRSANRMQFGMPLVPADGESEDEENNGFN